MRSRQISAASPRSCRQTPATAEHLSKHRRPISRGWRPATSMPMWGDRPGQRRRCRQGRGPRRAALNAAGRITDASRGHARKDQGRRARQPLPAAQATPRAGVRADQAGTRIPPVPVARHRQGARRVGHRLHRPQSSQARTQAESVRSLAVGRCRGLNKAGGVTNQVTPHPIHHRAWPMSIRHHNLDGLLAAVTGLGLLAKPPFGAAQSSRGADGARLLKGALDLHFHMDPWTPERVRGAGIAEVLAARASGMRGLVIKDHSEPTAPLAYHLRQVVPGLELYGGFVLNLPNGGANPAGIEFMATQIRSEPGRIVWMPAGDTEKEVRESKSPNGPFVAVSRNGELLPEVKQII